MDNQSLQVLTNAIALNDKYLVYVTMLIAILAVCVAIFAIITQIFLNKKRNEHISQIAEEILKSEEDGSEMITAIIKSKLVLATFF